MLRINSKDQINKIKKGFMMQEEKPNNFKLPKMLSSIGQAHEVMKFSLVVTIVLFLLTLVILIYQVSKDPLVLTFNTSAERLTPNDMPKLEGQVTQAVKYYIDHRYNWEPSDIEKKLSISRLLVKDSVRDLFSKAVIPIISFSKERNVTQKVYVSETGLNLSKKSILINGDRITSVQGLKAVGNFKLELSFDYGERTLHNPWGIYITKEKED